MKLLALFWRLLRYRVAVMLLLFMLLSAARHAKLADHTSDIILAAVALGFSYVSATSSNDLADEKIDTLNHPDSPGRPLISGVATRRDMWLMFSVSSLAAIVSASCISLAAGGLLVLSVLLNVLYSLPPARISYRTFLAPLLLGLAYVGVPTALGVAAVHGSLQASDAWWFIGLYLLFVGRISLKDFRDRKGDAAYNKPTFLLRYGKSATCLMSASLVLIGGLVVISQLSPAWLIGLVLLFLASILAMSARLRQAPVGKQEQLSIGVGAKMGNGLLITLLAYFVIHHTKASANSAMLITILVAIVFFVNFVVFLKSPATATIAYKG